jgi:hypothetical protein
MMIMTSDPSPALHGAAKSVAEEEEEREEGFRLLLGGTLRLEDLSGVAGWDRDGGENDPDDECKRSFTEKATTGADLPGAEAVKEEPDDIGPIFSLAHVSCCGDDYDSSATEGTAAMAKRRGAAAVVASDSRPKVRVVRVSADRGCGLVAAACLRRGAAAFTERAAVACQIPSGPLLARGASSRDLGSRGDPLFGVWACQNCFRSLEPCPLGLPLPELWPIAGDYNEDSESSPSELVARHRQCCAVRCGACSSGFCSRQCHDRIQEELGSCCSVRSATDVLLRHLGDAGDLVGENDPSAADSQHDEVANESLSWDQLPALAVAVRALLRCLHQYRQSPASKDPGDDILERTAFQGLCGESSDVVPLELGLAVPNPQLPSSSRPTEKVLASDCSFEQRQPDCASCAQVTANAKPSSPTVGRTLEPIYRQLRELWVMTESEAAVFDLVLFQRLSAVAARNGVEMVPQSPFSTYYQSLLRATGGRGTARHGQAVAQVAAALSDGSTDRLERGMDRRVQSRVSPAVAAIFPLASRLNHDCRPTCELVSGYADCHVDVRLLRDVMQGEELTINYVGRFGGRNKNREQRQLELRRRYLFQCSCDLCNLESGRVSSSS